MPFLLSVCLLVLLQQHFGTAQAIFSRSTEDWQKMSCIATNFATSLADKQKPRGKNHKVSTAQVCLTCWAGLPVTVCASQAIKGDLGGTGPICPLAKQCQQDGPYREGWEKDYQKYQ